MATKPEPKIERKECSSCALRFKCFTTNTAQQPRMLKDANFEVAKCCYRCKHSKYRMTGGGKEKDPKETLFYSHYRRVGECLKHKCLVHHLNVCQDFEPKADNNDMCLWLLADMRQELLKLNGSGFPRYCIIKEEKNDS